MKNKRENLIIKFNEIFSKNVIYKLQNKKKNRFFTITVWVNFLSDKIISTWTNKLNARVALSSIKVESVFNRFLASSLNCN